MKIPAANEILSFARSNLPGGDGLTRREDGGRQEAGRRGAARFAHGQGATPPKPALSPRFPGPLLAVYMLAAGLTAFGPALPATAGVYGDSVLVPVCIAGGVKYVRLNDIENDVSNDIGRAPSERPDHPSACHGPCICSRKVAGEREKRDQA